MPSNWKNAASAQLISILETMPIDRTKLRYRSDNIDEEIDYEDEHIEIHIMEGSTENKFLVNGEIEQTMESAKEYFGNWIRHFSSHGVKCSIELYVENETGDEIENFEIKSPLI